MSDEQTDKFERRLRFVAKHYREGAFDGRKAWEQFVSGRKHAASEPKRAESGSSEERTFAGKQVEGRTVDETNPEGRGLERTGLEGRDPERTGLERIQIEGRSSGSRCVEKEAVEGTPCESSRSERQQPEERVSGRHLFEGILSGEPLSDKPLSGEPLSEAPLVRSEQGGATFCGATLPPCASSSQKAPSPKAAAPLRLFFRRYGIAAAALAGLLIGITLFYGLRRDRPDWVAVATAAGQTKEVYLPDSSQVTMAGGSEIRYDRKSYGKERRVVEMKGKLFFQVKRNVARPFSVHTRYTEVTVLGTSFQVDAQGELTQVHVSTGKVRFAASGTGKTEEVILTAGMSARYAATPQSMTLAAEATANELSWKTGELHFKDTPLEQVIDDLNACYQVQIGNRPKTAGMKPIKLTATFRQRPLEEVLTVINQTLDTRLAVDSVR